MAEQIIGAVREALVQFTSSLLQLLPRILAVLVILLVGWVAAVGLRRITRKLLRIGHFDRLVDRAGGGQTVPPMVHRELHAIIGTAVYGLTWLVTLLAMLDVLEIKAARALASEFVLYLPRIGAALVVLVVGVLCASLAWRATLLAAVNARLPAARMLAALVRVLVLVAFGSMALEQLGLGKGVVHTAFAITFGSIMLACSIAFGFGGRHAARKLIERHLLAAEEKDEDGRSHL